MRYRHWVNGNSRAATCSSSHLPPKAVNKQCNNL
jgi:hypothetical protein